MSDDFFGTPRSENFEKKNYFSFKKDQNTLILRILPPLGDLAKQGIWSRYQAVEYGYKDSKGRLRPFLSTRVVDKKTKMVIQESQAHLKRENIKAQLEQSDKLGNEALSKKLNEMLRNYNQETRHYMNALDLNGNVGLFKLQHKAFLALKKAMEDMRASGVEPLSLDNGRYFVFSRSGQGRDTIFSVLPYKQKIKANVNGVDRYIEEELVSNIMENKDLIAKIKAGASNLDKVATILTPEQEERVVLGGVAGIDEVFSTNKNEASKTAPVAQQAPAQSSSVPNNVHVSEDDESGFDMEDEVYIPNQSIQTSSNAAKQTQSVAAVSNAAIDLTKISNDQLLEMLNNGTLGKV